MGFASSAVFYGLMNMVDAVPIWKIFMYTIISLICLGLIEISAQVFIKLRSKKGKKTNMTFNVREEMFYEYTYQMLFGKISKNWKDKENYRNPYDILREKIENENFQSKEVKSKEIELIPCKFFYFIFLFEKQIIEINFYGILFFKIFIIFFF